MVLLAEKQGLNQDALFMSILSATMKYAIYFLRTVPITRTPTISGDMLPTAWIPKARIGQCGLLKKPQFDKSWFENDSSRSCCDFTYDAKFWMAVASLILSGFSAVSISFGCCSGNTFKFNCVELPWKTYELPKLPGYPDNQEKGNIAANGAYPDLPEKDSATVGGSTSGLNPNVSPSAPRDEKKTQWC